MRNHTALILAFFFIICAYNRTVLSMQMATGVIKSITSVFMPTAPIKPSAETGPIDPITHDYPSFTIPFLKYINSLKPPFNSSTCNPESYPENIFDIITHQSFKKESIRKSWAFEQLIEVALKKSVTVELLYKWLNQLQSAHAYAITFTNRIRVMNQIYQHIEHRMINQKELDFFRAFSLQQTIIKALIKNYQKPYIHSEELVSVSTNELTPLIIEKSIWPIIMKTKHPSPSRKSLSHPSHFIGVMRHMLWLFIAQKKSIAYDPQQLVEKCIAHAITHQDELTAEDIFPLSDIFLHAKSFLEKSMPVRLLEILNPLNKIKKHFTTKNDPYYIMNQLVEKMITRYKENENNSPEKNRILEIFSILIHLGADPEIGLRTLFKEINDKRKLTKDEEDIYRLSHDKMIYVKTYSGS